MKNHWISRHRNRNYSLVQDDAIMNDWKSQCMKVPTWDFQTEIGDKIKGKYESLYIKVAEITNLVNRQPLPSPVAAPSASSFSSDPHAKSPNP